MQNPYIRKAEALTIFPHNHHIILGIWCCALSILWFRRTSTACPVFGWTHWLIFLSLRLSDVSLWMILRILLWEMLMWCFLISSVQRFSIVIWRSSSINTQTAVIASTFTASNSFQLFVSLQVSKNNSSGWYTKTLGDGGSKIIWGICEVISGLHPGRNRVLPKEFFFFENIYMPLTRLHYTFLYAFIPLTQIWNPIQHRK